VSIDNTYFVGHTITAILDIVSFSPFRIGEAGDHPRKRYSKMQSTNIVYMFPSDNPIIEKGSDCRCFQLLRRMIPLLEVGESNFMLVDEDPIQIRPEVRKRDSIDVDIPSH
jgi:hypothetical protein